MTGRFRRAIARLVEQVDATEATVGERFPVYADPVTGSWTTSRRGSWVAGFWVGQLWLRARLTGDRPHLGAAESWVQRLWPAAEADTVTRGLVLWYGAAAGSRLEMSDAGVELARLGASELGKTFDSRAGVLPWGTAFGDPAEPVIARVDGLAGTVPLLAWAGITGAADVHLRTHLDICCVDDEIVPAWEWSRGRWRVRSEPPVGWSRGRPWMLLALADASRWLGADFGDRANRLIDRSQRLLTVPAAGYGHPEIRDTSAAAITAVALCKLERMDEAAELVGVLLSRHLRAEPGAGGLLGGCYDLERGIAVEHELVWGNFFLMLAVAILAGDIPATAI